MSDGYIYVEPEAGTYEEVDAPTVEWVDQQLTAVEQGGNLHTLALHLESYSFVEVDELANVFGQAEQEGAESESDEAPPQPMTREEIRELIFSRLRRPDGAPYAAGYTVGPAARKPEYVAEDTTTGWRAPNDATLAGTDKFTTRYEPRDDIGDRAAGIDRGLVIGSDGAPVNGQWGWVMDDESGYLLLFNPSDNEVIAPDGQVGPVPPGQRIWSLIRDGFKVRAIHHTTPVAGMPVKGAGMMTLDQGQITEITDESGHYRPDAVQQFYAFQALLQQGYDLREATVRLTGNDMHGRPTGKAGWIDEANDENPDFPTGDLSLRPEQFAQTQGDEYQIRMKAALNEEIKARGETAPTVEGTSGVQPPPQAYQYYDPNSGSDSGSNYVYNTSENEPGGNVYLDGPPNLDTDGQPRPYLDGPPDLGDGAPYNNEAPESPDVQFVRQAREYLTAAGRSDFANWFRTLTGDQQTQLLADPAIAAAWQAEPAASPAWVPGDDDQAQAATANATFVDSLDDRESAVFTLGGFMMLIGDGHDNAHQNYVDTARDSSTGRMTVRKAGVGRGAGSLTFTGVPPAKQEIVREAVARFSRKAVRFE